MSTDEIVETYEVNPGFGEEMTRYQTDHIRGETGPTEYTCPSCATMVTYGDCRNKDELCETISHPLGYYRKKLDELDDEDEGAEDESEDEEAQKGDGDEGRDGQA
jgi:DNA primase large subunit